MDTLNSYSLGEIRKLLAEEARNLESLLSKELAGNPRAEPEFVERIERVRSLSAMIWRLSGDDPQAMQLAKTIPILPADVNPDGLPTYLHNLTTLA